VLAIASTPTTSTRHGLRILRDATPEDVPRRAVPVSIGRPATPPGVSIDTGARAPRDVLAYLTHRYGDAVSAFVATQLEYPSDAPE
jgi:hypothetical protein